MTNLQRLGFGKIVMLVAQHSPEAPHKAWQVPNMALVVLHVYLQTLLPQGYGK